MAVKKDIKQTRTVKKTIKYNEPSNTKNKYLEIFSQLQYKLKNTIFSTIMLGMLLFIGILLVIHASIIHAQINEVQIDLDSRDFFELVPYSPIFDANSDFYDTNRYHEKYHDIFLVEEKRKINDELKEKDYPELISKGFDDDIKVENIVIINNDKKRTKDDNYNNIIVASTFNNSSELASYKTNLTGSKRLFKVSNKKKEKLVKRHIGQYDIYMIVTGLNIIADNKSYLKKFDNFETRFFAIIMLLSLFLVYVFARSISKPIIEMEKPIARIAQGDLSGRLEYTKYDELNQLVTSYNGMADSLQRLYSTLEKQVQDRTQELKSAYAELQSTQAMMVHSEKMKSLGELVAGIMHEINNPINFIYGNMTHLSNYSNDLINIIEEYTKYNESLKPEEKANIENLKSDIDYEFLKTDLPDLIKSCKEGADRAKNIIQDLKSFSRMEEVAITDVDLGKEVDTVLNILHNKIKNKAEVHKEYNPSEIPAVEAFGGQLNQVFMNILDNAVGAIEEHGDIWIRMKKDDIGKNVIIEIEDNGMGMDAETAEKVFNPFFTTKPVGQGTGLGMSITYKIIKNHQGNIRVESKKGEGAKFILTLPINLNRDALKSGAGNGENNG